MNPDFEFDLNDKVLIAKRVAGNENGIVLGRAEYADQPPQYYVGYVDGMGCYRKDWFTAQDLTHDA